MTPPAARAPGASPSGSYWDQTAAPFTPEKVRIPARADVIIIGAGYTGLTAAYHLAGRGLRPVLIDARTIGFGASGRNGGQLLPGVEPSADRLAGRLGTTTARALWNVAAEGLAEVEKLIQHEKIECDFEAHGHIEAAQTVRERDDLLRLGEFLDSQFGFPSQFLDKADMSQALGTDCYISGLRDAASRAFHPLAYARGLAAACIRRGAIIIEGTRALAVERWPAGFRVRLGGGHIVFARTVILATNAYSPPFARSLRRSFLCFRTSMLATAPLPEELQMSLLPGRETVSDQNALIHYFRLSADGRLLFGQAGNVGAGAMAAMFPLLRTVPVTHGWSGLVAVPRDGLPHIGQTASGVLYAGGYAGHGAALSCVFGRKLAELALHPGEWAHILGPFADLPLEPYPAWSAARATALIQRIVSVFR